MSSLEENSQDQYKEMMKRSVKRGKAVPRNGIDMLNTNDYRLHGMDEPTIEAYERYVLAQFKFSDVAEIEKERAAAIETLIPGTINYYHLFFLDLIKKKKTFASFTQEEKDMYSTFEEKHGKQDKFYEVEMQLLVLNRLENLPEVKTESSDADVQQNVDLIEYFYDKFVPRQNKMKKRYEDKTGDDDDKKPARG